MIDKRTGSCVCGGVAYEVAGPLREIIACHCEQCRKTSGHHVAATQAPAAAMTFLADETLAWYRSSDAAERGFCRRCGGSLFWRRVGDDRVSIMAGTLDDTSDLSMNRHIFVRFKADYFDPPAGADLTEGGG